MTADQWKAVESLFSELAELPVNERRARLDAIPDEAVRFEVASLIDHADGSGTIELAIADVASRLDTEAEQPQRFGVYRVVRRLGQGGQGAVFEAVRDDSNFQQRVAIKVVRWEVDDEPARARFRQERQILARLEHPNIARLLDGGETPQGAPYLVMEFVEGQPLIEATESWPLKRKLRLFTEILSAVAYAHRNLIVHRDLKPGNILVTPDGSPKLLDFGIARLIEDENFATVTAMRAFTPSYASPEQIQGQQITTASDVYSLGVVLYELLTGRRPYEVQTTSLLEMHRVVCQDAPGDPQLGTDLDNILLMALRKEPQRRYLSVLDFADDIAAFLDYRPVRARADTFLYRTSKFLRRYRTGVAFAALFAVCIITAFIWIVKAERQARNRFEQLRNLATTFMVDFDNDLRILPGAASAREKLVSTALQQLEGLSRDANDFQLTSELVRAYALIGDVLGMPGTPNLGHPDRAEKSYRKSVELAEQLMRMDSRPESQARTRAATTYSRFGYMLARMRRIPEARSMMQKAEVYIVPKIETKTAAADDFRTAANTYTYLAQLEATERHPRLAASYAVKALGYMKTYESLAPSVRSRFDVSRAAFAEAFAASHFDLERAVRVAKESIARLEELLRESPNNVDVARSINIESKLMADWLFVPNGPCLNRPKEARQALERALAVTRGLSEQAPKDNSFLLEITDGWFGLALLDVEMRPAQAEAGLLEAIRSSAKVPDTYPGKASSLGLVYLSLAQALQNQNRSSEAAAALVRAEVLFRSESSPREPGKLLQAEWRLFYEAKGRILLSEHKPAEAIEQFDRLWLGMSPMANTAPENIDDAFHLAEAAGDLARAWAAKGDKAKAAEWAARRDAIWKGWAGKYAETDRRLGFGTPPE